MVEMQMRQSCIYSLKHKSTIPFQTINKKIRNTEGNCTIIVKRGVFIEV